jgi:hypothetical protein
MPNSQSNLEQKEKSWKHIPPDVKIYFKFMVVKTTWYRNENRYTGQWKRIEKPGTGGSCL